MVAMSAEIGASDRTGVRPLDRAGPGREVGMVSRAAKARGMSGQGLTEADWDRLLTRIKEKKCTPFLGSEAVELRERPQDDPQYDALLRWLRKRKPELSPDEENACFGKVPSSSLLARVLAERYGYPWIDEDDLARVTQFVATQVGWDRPRADIIDILRRVKPPDFGQPDEPHGVLAGLPLPVYITTTYYDFMTQALLQNESMGRTAITERCRWDPDDREDPMRIPQEYNAESSRPLVYHLYGQIGAEKSLVLTEDDYLDFLMNTSEYPELIPAQVRKALSNTTLLFLGYHNCDLEFRILLRRLAAWPYFMKNDRKPHVSVQIVAVGDGPAKPRAYSTLEYLREYCGELKISVHPGTSRQFIEELKDRWERFNA
jgi:SIR2-like domain